MAKATWTVGALVGAVAGIIVGLLTAPKSGNIRGDIQETGEKIRKQAAKKVVFVKKQLQDNVKQGK